MSSADSCAKTEMKSVCFTFYSTGAFTGLLPVRREFSLVAVKKVELNMTLFLIYALISART